MPVIPVDANHPAASAARRTAVGERQHAPTRTSPPRAAKTRATMVMHNALAPAAARHPRDDSASYSGASFAAASSVAVGHPSPPLSVGSTSDSDDSKINGGGGAAIGRKSSGLTDDYPASPPASPNFSTGGGDDVSAGRGDDFDDMPTDSEASKYSFWDRLEHYMERAPISDENRKAVELAIMVEAGTTVREMDPMKKEAKEKAFLNSYVSIIQEIADDRFDQASVRPAMLLAYKGARKKILEGATLWRKYESELNEVRKFALKFPGVGNLSQLPSGTAQLHQMKKPLIIKLWKEKYPTETGVDYDDDVSVWQNIPDGWWLNHDACKYILSCLVHKDNKDITTKPTHQPPGHSRVEARERKEKALESERAAAKAARPVEKYGDVDHQLKKVRVEGLQSQVAKNRADAIKTRVDAVRAQIEMMQQMETVYVRKMGQDKYDDMIVSLMNQMPGMENSIDISVAAGSANATSPTSGLSSLLEE